MLNISEWLVTKSALDHGYEEEEILGLVPAGRCKISLLREDDCYHIDEILPSYQDVYEALCEVSAHKVAHILFCDHDYLGVVFHAKTATHNTIKEFEERQGKRKGTMR